MPINLKRAYEQFGVDEKKKDFALLQIPQITKNDKSKYKNLMGGNVQADLQFWNENAGYRYLLVIVDVVTKRIDVEPIKNKFPSDIIKAFEEIFKRKYIKHFRYS